MARALVERHAGAVPETMDGLVALPGVARKTANVVLGCALGKNEGVIVDTHVTRLAGRLGLSAETDPAKIELDLMRLVARDQWTKFANGLIWHGRRVCDAKKPDCEHCTIAPECPSAGLGELIAEQRERVKQQTKQQTKKPAKKKPARPVKKRARA